MATVVLRVSPDAGQEKDLRTALDGAGARIQPDGATWLVRLDGDPETMRTTLRSLALRFRCMAVLRI